METACMVWCGAHAAAAWKYTRAVWWAMQRCVYCAESNWLQPRSGEVVLPPLVAESDRCGHPV
eukprot:1367312-Rhodomonas_salina.1